MRHAPINAKWRNPDPGRCHGLLPLCELVTPRLEESTDLRDNDSGAAAIMVNLGGGMWKG